MPEVDPQGPTPDTCSWTYRVRFDEAGPDGRLRTSVLLRYAQDLAWFHSAQRGFDRDWYRSRGLTWLVRAAEVGVERPIETGSDIVGTTQVVGWRRVLARRRTEFQGPDGHRAAWVHIDWVLVDERGSPTRIPAEFEPVFGATAGTVSVARVVLGSVPGDAVDATFLVRPQELDPMDHVNNAIYADWLEEQVIAAGGEAGASHVRAVPRSLRLEYARAADAGATVRAVTWADPPPRDESTRPGWSCLISDLGGAPLLRARLEA